MPTTTIDRDTVARFFDQFLSSSSGSVAIVSGLLAEHPYLGRTVQSGNLHTALMMGAMRLSTPDLIHLLVPYSDVHARDATGNTALMLAAENANLVTLTALLAHSDAQATNENGDNALMLAARVGFSSGVEALLSRDAAEQQNYYGQTALMLATRSGSETSVRLLLPHSDVEDRSASDDANALNYAADRGSLACLDLLIQASSLERCDDEGRTPLMRAIPRAQPAVLDRLLAASSPATRARTLPNSEDDAWAMALRQARQNPQHCASLDCFAPYATPSQLDEIFVLSHQKSFLCPHFAPESMAQLLPGLHARLEHRALAQTLGVTAGPTSQTGTAEGLDMNPGTGMDTTDMSTDRDQPVDPGRVLPRAQGDPHTSPDLSIPAPFVPQLDPQPASPTLPTPASKTRRRL